MRHHRPLRRRAPRRARGLQRHPVPRQPGAADPRALQVAPRRGHRHALGARDRGPRHRPRRRRTCSSASRWCAGSRTRSPTTSSQLGTDGRLLSLQLEELTGGLSDDLGLVIRDYLPEAKAGHTLEEAHRQPRGHRLHRAARPGGRAPGRSASPSSATRSTRRSARSATGCCPRCRACPGAIVDRLVGHFGSLQKLLAANIDDLMDVDGVGEGRARARARGPVAPGRVEHPRALRLTRVAVPARTAGPAAASAAAAPSSTSASSTGTPATPGRCRGATRRAPRGACSSPRSCRSRPPSPGSSRSGGSGCTRWPTPADLAAESPGEVVRAWGRLGYPRRALRLREAAVADRRAARRGGARRRGGAARPARRRRLHRGRRHGVRLRAPHHRRRHQRAAGARPGRRGREHCRTVPSTAAESALAASLVPATPRRLGHLERRGHGARRPGLPRPGAPAARSARSQDLCAWVAAGRPGARRARLAGARRGTAPTGRCAAPLLQALRDAHGPVRAVGARRRGRGPGPGRPLPRLARRGRAARTGRRRALPPARLTGRVAAESPAAWKPGVAPAGGPSHWEP